MAGDWSAGARGWQRFFPQLNGVDQRGQPLRACMWSPHPPRKSWGPSEPRSEVQLARSWAPPKAWGRFGWFTGCWPACGGAVLRDWASAAAVPASPRTVPGRRGRSAGAGVPRAPSAQAARPLLLPPPQLLRAWEPVLASVSADGLGPLGARSASADGREFGFPVFFG